MKNPQSKIGISLVGFVGAEGSPALSRKTVLFIPWRWPDGTGGIQKHARSAELSAAYLSSWQFSQENLSRGSTTCSLDSYRIPRPTRRSPWKDHFLFLATDGHFGWSHRMIRRLLKILPKAFGVRFLH